jgi:hypothetical protein
MHYIASGGILTGSGGADLRASVTLSNLRQVHALGVVPSTRDGPKDHLPERSRILQPAGFHTQLYVATPEESQQFSDQSRPRPFARLLPHAFCC